MGVKIPDESEYSDYDGVVLFDGTETELQMDSEYGYKAVQTVHVVKKLFKNVEKYSDVAIDFSYEQKLMEIEARVIKPDNTIINLNKEDFYMPESNEEGIFLTSNHTLKFAFPRVSKNCIIEYIYKVVNYSHLNTDDWWIQNIGMPTLKSQYILEVPKKLVRSTIYGGWDINWNAKAYNYFRTEKPEPMHTAGEKTKTVWTLKDIPAFEPEKRMPPLTDLITRVKFARNDWETWDDCTKYYYLRWFMPSLEINDQVKNLAIELTKDCKTEFEKIEKIYNYVRKIRYVGVELGFGGYAPRTPSFVIDKQYGDCKDKATLIIALCRSLKIDADPVLVRTRDHGLLDPYLVTWNFNHMIARVKTADGDKYWLDGTAKFCKFGNLPWHDEDIYVLVIKPDGTHIIEKTPSSAFKDNFSETSISCNISSDCKLSYKIEVKSGGSEENSYRYLFNDRNEKDIKKILKSIFAKDGEDIEIKDINHTPTDSLDIPFVFSFNYEGTKDLKRQGQDYLFETNTLDILPGMEWLAEKDRKFPVWFHYPNISTNKFEITYDTTQFKIKSMPSNLKLPDDDFFYSKIFYEGTNGKIIGNETFNVQSRIIENKRYDTLKTYFKKINAISDESIMIGKR
jgi:hypothetical protein